MDQGTEWVRVSPKVQRVGWSQSYMHFDQVQIEMGLPHSDDIYFKVALPLSSEIFFISHCTCFSTPPCLASQSTLCCDWSSEGRQRLYFQAWLPRCASVKKMHYGEYEERAQSETIQTSLTSNQTAWVLTCHPVVRERKSEDQNGVWN